MSDRIGAARLPGVDGQVIQAAGEISPEQTAQPEWLWHRQEDPMTTYGRWPRHTGQAPYVRLDIALAEIERLRALVTRLTSVADDLSRETSDPGTEALAAIHCGRHFIYG